MAECNLIINVSAQEFTHGNGLSGMHIVPACKDGEKFSLLVVYPTPEIQDIGDSRSVVHWLKARPLAENIIGMKSEEGIARWGVHLCAAEPDLPKSLSKALESEMEYLNDNRPQSTYVMTKDKIKVAVNREPEEVKREKIRLSLAVLDERQKFHAECRTLVTPQEIKAARGRMIQWYQHLVVSADQMWAKGPEAQKDINDAHRRACEAMGQERPWCYAAVEQFPCPGCGKPCREGVITCASCGAIFDLEIEQYAAMSNSEKARTLYPHRFADDQAQARHKMDVETGKIRKG